MAPSQWRSLFCTVCVSILVAACVSSAGTAPDADEQNKLDLTRPILNAAAAALDQGDAATAATYYRGVFTHDPDNVTAAAGLIRSLRLAGGLDEAQAVAAKALKLKPDDPALLAEAGKVKLAMGEAAAAARFLARAAAADAGDWRLRSALGLAYDRLGKYGRADQNYEAALKLSPDNAAVLNNFALSRAMANDLDGARGLAQRASAAPGADLRVRQNLALIYALSGDISKAADLTRRDLPPALARQTIQYYRDLAAASPPPHPFANR
jgi:Flp pilus assembly protein TadD